MINEKVGKGDDGKSTLSSELKISKSDPRFAFLGALDELSAAIYAYKSALGGDLSLETNKILETLKRISDGVYSPRNASFSDAEKDVSYLEERINRAQKSDYAPKTEVACKANIARAIARRAEREAVRTNERFAVSKDTIKYLNRLSDYLRSLTIRLDGENSSAANAAMVNTAASEKSGCKTPEPTEESGIVAEVVKRIMKQRILSLETAKKIIEEVEKESRNRGKKAVICVCNEQGNPIAVHVMDGAFLISFDVAVKKAYTAVALKMPTLKLNDLVKSGQTFYGLQNLDKVMTIGGGVPLYRNGILVGGLGVSGGTGEEDDSLARFGADIFNTL
ncbi:MAG: ATP:cob(I)alamin adenosyltransferase [Clostridia bacterium]|nr:ATP:cob(I)alamin adenosyltransferase [Clostridia bacterium]